MPRYFFDVKNGHRLVHPAGLECRDDQEAIAKATVIAQQIARESEASEGRHVSVITSNGDEVGKVRIVSELHHQDDGKSAGFSEKGRVVMSTVPA
jgi:uncharacterized protein DUF6894